MPSVTLPTAYADFFQRAFGKQVGGEWDSAYLFEVAEAKDALDECSECGTPVINQTAFVESIAENYVLTDEQVERMEEELGNCGVDVSDEELCLEHGG